MKNINNELEYLKALETIKLKGIYEPDRTGTGTWRYPGITMRFDLNEGFPILTTKKVLFYPMTVELLWFLQGRNDLKWLQERNCNIWNSWHDEDYTIGRGYGVQWRSWGKGPVHHVDQLKEAADALKTNPQSRRIIVSAWNVAELNKMALPPCHFAHQYIAIDGTLHMMMHQRSGDFFLGVPFNVSSYALLLHIMAKEAGLKVGTLTHTIGDAHIYANHMDQVEEQLSRAPKSPPDLVLSEDLFPSPWEDTKQEKGLFWWLKNKCPEVSLDEIRQLIKLENYESHPFIKAPVAV